MYTLVEGIKTTFIEAEVDLAEMEANMVVLEEVEVDLVVGSQRSLHAKYVANMVTRLLIVGTSMTDNFLAQLLVPCFLCFLLQDHMPISL